MIDPDFLYETHQNRKKLDNLKVLIDDFYQLRMPNTLQYMRLIDRIKDIVCGEKNE